MGQPRFVSYKRGSGKEPYDRKTRPGSRRPVRKSRGSTSGSIELSFGRLLNVAFARDSNVQRLRLPLLLGPSPVLLSDTLLRKRHEHGPRTRIQILNCSPQRSRSSQRVLFSAPFSKVKRSYSASGIRQSPRAISTFFASDVYRRW